MPGTPSKKASCWSRFPERGHGTTDGHIASNAEPGDPPVNAATDPSDLILLNPVGSAGWRLFQCAEAVSTNDLARSLHPWNAVRAARQTTGRGRFGRQFVSDEGGLWISAVLPATDPSARWAGFSLMVGCHLVKMLEEWHVPAARLRWPNDLMAGRKKLGGLLLEQAQPGALIVGFGLNVSNAPWDHDPALATIATSLCRETRRDWDLETVTTRTLDALADAHQAMLEGGMAAAISELNNRWASPVPVELQLSTGSTTTGRLAGLDPEGHLRLLDAEEREFLVEHQSVEKLVELL